MKLGVVFATSDEAFRNFLVARKEAILPSGTVRKDFAANRPTSFSVATIPPDALADKDVFGRKLIDLAEPLAGMVLLVDDLNAHLADDYRDALFVGSLPMVPPGMQYANRAGAAAAPLLKNYAAMRSVFEDAKFQKPLLLPLEVFQAPELTAIRTLVSHDAAAPGFGQTLIDLLAKLRSRQKPKNRAQDRRTYLVDDASLFFEYGHEEDKVPKTDAPPHDIRCKLNSEFRFGLRYNRLRHFNISDGLKNRVISGPFRSCHGGVIHLKGDPHLNVFPNAYAA